jgi:hypothetical protein
MNTNRHEMENYSWGILQELIEREVNSAFKLRAEPLAMPTKKEIKQIIRTQCKHHRKKKLSKNEHWSPNPFELKKLQS